LKDFILYPFILYPTKIFPVAISDTNNFDSQRAKGLVNLVEDFSMLTVFVVDFQLSLYPNWFETVTLHFPTNTPISFAGPPFSIFEH
jgi:hypothetical protein